MPPNSPHWLEAFAFGTRFGKSVIIYPTSVPAIVDIKTFHRNNKHAEKTSSMPIYMPTCMDATSLTASFIHETLQQYLKKLRVTTCLARICLLGPLYTYIHTLMFPPQRGFSGIIYKHVTNYNTQP